ncbi:MAG: ParB N-terminal domain-containing protein [Anaerolineae bacterium]|nr:ParB N-terminal domain-containing protein [Anaerolineae bacterium]
MTNLTTTPQPRVAGQAMPMASSMASSAAPVANTTHYLPLGRIMPDLRQPRKWLPVDIRAGLGISWQTGVDAMQELLRRAGGGDLEAQGYVLNLKRFAYDIMEVGLQVPISVFLQAEGSEHRYRIKQGERRWWACLYLAATSDLSPNEALTTSIEAFVEPEDDTQTDDEIRRMQWSENIQREDVAQVDVICEVGRAYTKAYSRAVANRKAVLDSLDWADEEQVASDLAVALAQRELQSAIGRTFSRSAIMKYAQLTEKIGASSRGLARAFHFSFRELKRLAQAPLEQQEELARAMANAGLRVDGDMNIGEKAQPTKPVIGEPSGGAQNGRPTRAHQFVSLCLKLPEQLSKSTDRHLAQLEPTDLQAMMDAAKQASHALEEYHKRLSAMLSRPGLRGS